MATTKKTKVIKSGKAGRSALTGKSVSDLKSAGSWESARIAGKYLKKTK
ncbi:MAG: hypothetical protein M3N29_00775 [Chloroflexota bacterium]|nr:hypothetical protein [Chloroflexota bacterium]